LIIRELSNKMLEEREAGPHVVIVGSNPADGFIIYGPFKDGWTARDWLSETVDGNGWTQPLEAPDA
jgi:hypothetical protein